MSIPENIESDYIEFLLTLSICSLNEEEKKINKLYEENGSAISWSSRQHKERKELLIHLNEIYPIKNQMTHIKEKNRKIRKPITNAYDVKIWKENKKYITNKDLFLKLINERKKVLLNETKIKEKNKALDDITCECGLQSKRKHISTHRKSATHIKLMSIAKETPLCTIIAKETPKEIAPKIIEEENVDYISEEEDDDESEEESDMTSKPFTLEQIKQFRIKNKLDDDYPLKIEKNLLLRQKWNIIDTELIAINKKENGITCMPLIIIGIQ
jgi:hypothetical protein